MRVAAGVNSAPAVIGGRSSGYAIDSAPNAAAATVTILGRLSVQRAVASEAGTHTQANSAPPAKVLALCSQTKPVPGSGSTAAWNASSIPMASSPQASQR